MESPGWQPLRETNELFNDIVGLINAPLETKTQIRLSLFLYCHILEIDYIPHVLHNILRVIKGEAPLIWQHLNGYRTIENRAIPPSARYKLSDIIKETSQGDFNELAEVFNQCIDWKIRNAFYHSDYILWEDKIRFKHGEYIEIEERPLNTLTEQIHKLMIFFQTFTETVHNHQTSYSDGHIISGRKKDGRNLGSIKLKVDPNYGLMGFEQSDPLPTW